LPDGTPLLTWENPPARPLEYDARADEYRAESGPRTAGEAVHIGLLLPGETVSFRPQVRLLNLPRLYLLNYHSYSPDQVSQNVYFEVLGEGPLRYRRLVVADVVTLPVAKQVAATHRSVIFPYAHSPTENPRTTELVLDVETPPRRFRLADALRRASLTAEQVVESTYCVYLDSWAVRTRDKGWLISARAVSPLPRLSRFELCFFHLDTIESHLPAQFEFTGALDVRLDRRVVPMRDAQGRTRRLAFIAREEVAGFLKEVAEKDLEIEVRAEGRSMSLLLRSARQSGTATISLADALKKAGIPATDRIEDIWSEALGAWAVRTKTRSWQVSERGAAGLPPITWFVSFFQKLDERAAAGQVKFIIPAEEIDAFPFAPGGVVRKGDLGRFLTSVMERGLTIEVPAEKDASFRLKR
ncbi:MAG TPA: hypothetical protein VJU16_00600, partial [Planctomycetota bacterium]|nr:hypothetical protein [Planctomycetota bacterium]